jgi:dihydrofolate synthase / folylpolyglutamate synthase
MMTYPETLEYLYSQLPVFHRVGAPAYKAGLDNIIALCTHLENPQSHYPCLHIAGTNGKGSSSHFLAAILQSAGYKVGLYTSPHLKDFSERIRVNGAPVAQDFVVDFVGKYKDLMTAIEPSFFEITVAMAFDYFAQEKVDIAVIEVGMGGRLDSTNIITPLVSLITNIGFDHQFFLGDTLPKIATEKAGIIKPHVPVVISEYHPETADVFIEKAQISQSEIYFAQDIAQVTFENGLIQYAVAGAGKAEVASELKGAYQQKNIAGVLTTIYLLQQQGWQITPAHIQRGLEQVVTLTGLKGRWQILQQAPLIVCDVAHNEAGIVELLAHVATLEYAQLHLLMGFSADKDLAKIFEKLTALPTLPAFHFCPYNAPRSMQVADLVQTAGKYGITGTAHADVNSALTYTKARAGKDDMILVCGSIFVIAEIAEL